MELMTFWCWELTDCGTSSPTRKWLNRSAVSWQTATLTISTGMFTHPTQLQSQTGLNFLSPLSCLERVNVVIFSRLRKFPNIQIMMSKSSSLTGFPDYFLDGFTFLIFVCFHLTVGRGIYSMAARCHYSLFWSLSNWISPCDADTVTTSHFRYLRYTMAAQDLIMRARGVLKDRGWRIANDRLGSGDDISVYIIPLMYGNKQN